MEKTEEKTSNEKSVLSGIAHRWIKDNALAFDPVAPFYDKSQVIPSIQYQIESFSNSVACLQLKLEHCKKRGFDQ